MQEQLQRSDVASLILGNSEAARRLRSEIVALSRAPIRSVLVTGETGTGKDLVPQALLCAALDLEPRLETFNCPAVPQDHLESELLGTVRGAYPGAIDRPGAAERASGGILFLDEIAAMPLAHQAKVLRLLETGEGRRLGATRGYRVQLTVVAASNADLAELAERGQFREDLYYRLVQDAVIHVPPLRERLEDVPLLARHFLQDFSERSQLTPEAERCLQQGSWPGNVRQLRAVVRGAARMARKGEIRPETILAALERIAPQQARAARAGAEEARPSLGFEHATLELRRSMLLEALARAGGNQTLAGLMLGLHARRHGEGAETDLRARKLAHRKFRYWWKRLVELPTPPPALARSPRHATH